VAALSPVATPDWRIVVGQSEASLLHAERSQLAAELVGLGVVAVLALAGAALVGRRLDRTHARQEATERFSAALASAADVPAAAAEALAEVFGAELVWVGTIDEEHGRLDIVADRGTRRQRADAWRHLPLDTPMALGTAINENRVLTLSREEYRARFPGSADDFDAEGLQGVVYAPFGRPRPRGAITLGFRRSFRFGPEPRALLGEVTAILADAVVRAQVAAAEHQTAITLQDALLPKPLTGHLPELQRAFRYIPGARQVQVGGDWYDLFELSASRLGLVIGDVVGRGASAAAAMGRMQTALRTAATLTPGPAAALSALDAVAGQSPETVLTTVVFGVLDLDRGQITLASAGHLPPVLATDDGTRVLTELTGPALGIGAAPDQRAEVTIDLRPEDTLVLYTDGLVERRDQGLEAGWTRLAAAVAEHHRLPIEELADRLLDALDLPTSDDDVALACVRLSGQPAATFSARYPADLSSLAAIRRGVRAWLADRDLPEPTQSDVVLAVAEAASNAVEHAYRGAVPADVLVELRVEDSRLIARVVDRGRWVAVQPNRTRGRGVAIIEALADRLEVETGPAGTAVRFELPV
jgi:anti-sigma regulatory factor (Ser/Thr protein kinase)